jgi:hypothetical protein
VLGSGDGVEVYAENWMGNGEEMMENEKWKVLVLIIRKKSAGYYVSNIF